jgi:predicted DNA-binding protein (MmcQ/YjbR family)
VYGRRPWSWASPLVTEYADVPLEVVDAMRSVCLRLPETPEEQAWAGTRWRIRKRTFAHVLTVDSANGPVTVVTFRSSGPELDALRSAGHPFFRPGWGTNVMGMVIDAAVDWDEVAELLTESYCVMAPKKLVALIDRTLDR